MKRIGIILGVFLLLAVSTTQIYAASEFGRIIRKGETVDEDIDVFDDDLTIEAGAIITGDITVFGGNVEIAGTINGDVAIFGGSADLNGEVMGDVAIFGGSLDINESAILTGDCVSLGGSLNNNSNSFLCDNFGGEFVAGITDSILDGINIEPPSPPELPDFDSDFSIRYEASSFLRGIGETITRTILFAAAAWVIASVYPLHLRRMTNTVQTRPFASGAVGILTTGAFLSLVAIVGILTAILIWVCIGILGIPVMMIMFAGFFGAVVAGWVAVGHIVGDRMTRRFNISDNDTVNTAVTGTVVLTLGLGIISALPSVLGSAFVADLLMGVIGFLGLGAAALTKFGREAYPVAYAPAAPINSDKVDSVLNTLADDE